MKSQICKRCKENPVKANGICDKCRKEIRAKIGIGKWGWRKK